MHSTAFPPILVAEDDANDMFLFTRLLKSAGVVNPLHIALNGEEALELLERVMGPRRLAQFPAVAFIDTRMPRFDGLEVLRWIRERRALDRLAVIMLSHSGDLPALSAAGKLGAQCYLTKYPSPATIARAMEEAAKFAHRPTSEGFDMPHNLLRPTDGGRAGRA